VEQTVAKRSRYRNLQGGGAVVMGDSPFNLIADLMYGVLDPRIRYD